MTAGGIEASGLKAMSKGRSGRSGGGAWVQFGISM